MPQLIESKHQRAFIEWCVNNRVNIEGLGCTGRRIREFICSIPNEGKRTVGEGYNLKMLGLTPGMPDLFLAIPVRGYSGLFIEFKRPADQEHGKGKLSNVQRQKIKDLKSVGYKCLVAFGIDEAIAGTQDYLYSKDANKKSYRER